MSYSTQSLVTSDFSREEAKVHAAIDRFFGTVRGQRMKTVCVTTPDGIPLYENGVAATQQVPDVSFPNVLLELKRLGVMLCGGAINSIFTGMTIKDLDFYVDDVRNISEVDELLKRFFSAGFISKNARTYSRAGSGRRKYIVQLITRFTGEPDVVFEMFDFTITHGCYEFAHGRFVVGPRFFADLSARRLVYSGKSLYPICAMYRTKKYQARGYELPGATVMHIALCIVQLDIKTYAELKEQLMGIDTMFLQDLLGEYPQEAAPDFGEFIDRAFKRISMEGDTMAEEEEGNA